jgi:hypothetical protein
MIWGDIKFQGIEMSADTEEILGIINREPVFID